MNPLQEQQVLSHLSSPYFFSESGSYFVAQAALGSVIFYLNPGLKDSYQAWLTYCFFFKKNYFMCVKCLTYTMYVYTTCMPSSLKSQKSPDPLDLEVVDSFELPCGFWESPQ